MKRTKENSKIISCGIESTTWNDLMCVENPTYDDQFVVVEQVEPLNEEFVVIEIFPKSHTVVNYDV